MRFQVQNTGVEMRRAMKFEFPPHKRRTKQILSPANAACTRLSLVLYRLWRMRPAAETRTPEHRLAGPLSAAVLSAGLCPLFHPGGGREWAQRSPSLA